MAAINRPIEATYVIHDTVTAETNDYEDHTFCGVLFPVVCKDVLPLEKLLINSISVRGRLGPLTVWIYDQTSERTIAMDQTSWTKIYEKIHQPSFDKFCQLDLSDNPIVMRPGELRIIYIHSALHSDEAIVYDNRRKEKTYDDALLSILTGRAHLSPEPFGNVPIWGWGNAWRDHRQFVGRIEYGAIYKLWNPVTHLQFGPNFQDMTRTMFLCQRRLESPVSQLPDDVIFYILNMCRWDWADDTAKTIQKMNTNRKRATIRSIENGAEGRAHTSANHDTFRVRNVQSKSQRKVATTCFILIMFIVMWIFLK
mmetsp:Transcript_29772/g.42254  ORF Transcript_29772/g.42254 Transcript_29772/m.42254 type:complete len:311 (+) Transcript_29772:76-1008(+)